MCPSIHTEADFTSYGVINLPTECVVPNCWHAHTQNDVRRNPFKADGSLAYLPVQCSSIAN